MILTNKFHLPAALVEAVRRDDYDAGASDFTVTQLIAPPQSVELARQHEHEITQDVSERGFVLMGKIAHGVLQRADLRNALTEERLFARVKLPPCTSTCKCQCPDLTVSVSGQFDRLVYTPEETLEDYKLTTVFSTKDGLLKSEWVEQLNLYAQLLRWHSFKPQRLRIIPLYRDWRRAEQRRERSWYPPAPLSPAIPVPLWDEMQARKHLGQRLHVHHLARAHGVITPCTDLERWARPARWAVMKRGAKRALRLCDSAANAEALANRYRREGVKAKVELRPSTNPRCEEYCAAAPWCLQWKALSSQSTRSPALWT